jgi:hypothetical protein
LAVSYKAKYTFSLQVGSFTLRYLSKTIGICTKFGKINDLAALFIIAKKLETPVVHQSVKWINKLWYSHSMEYY